MPGDKDVPKAKLPKLKLRRVASDAVSPARALASLESLPEHIRDVASQPGDRLCMNCKQQFFSLDVDRIRMCNDCKATHNGPREIHVTSDLTPFLE